MQGIDGVMTTVDYREVTNLEYTKFVTTRKFRSTFYLLT